MEGLESSPLSLGAPLGHKGSSMDFCADNMLVKNKKDKNKIFFMVVLFKGYLTFIEALMK